MGLKNDWHIDHNWTLFLDRDGVINQRVFGGYVTRPEEFIFQERSLEAIAGLSKLFGKIIVITNQQGIGKGIMSDSNLNEIHTYMVKEIVDFGGRIDLIKVATNLQGVPFDRRKPNPSMALESKEELNNIDLSKSVMVGDTDSDILFARNVGMKSVLVRSDENIMQQSDVVVESLFDFYTLLK